MLYQLSYFRINGTCNITDNVSALFSRQESCNSILVGRVGLEPTYCEVHYSRLMTQVGFTDQCCYLPMIKFYPTESCLLRRQDSNHPSTFIKHQPAMLQRPGHSVILYHILESNQFTPGSYLVSHVSSRLATCD